MTPDTFKSARHAMGLSRTDMANVLAMTRRSVERMERGEQGVSRSTEAHINTLLELYARNFGVE